MGRGDQPGRHQARAGPGRTRSQWCRCLPRESQRPLARGIDPRHQPRPHPGHEEHLQRHVGRPVAAPTHGVGSLRPPVPPAGARHRPHRPARALRPQPDGQQRLDLDGSGLPRPASRTRLSRRTIRRRGSASHGDGQGCRRASLRPARHRRLGAPGDVAGGAGAGRQPRGIRRRGGGGAASGRALHPRGGRVLLRYAGRHDPGVGGGPARGAGGCAPRPDGGVDPGLWRGVPVGDSMHQHPHRQPRPTRRDHAHVTGD